jgi:hypothetical protein
MMRRTTTLVILVLGGLLLLPGCDGGIEYPYFARVDRVEPPIPGLVVRTIGADLEITNNTG